MAGFTQRYSSYPGIETITQIEGVSIIDSPPPGSIQGVSTGVVCCVGEFADMAYATSVDSAGAVTTLCRPQEAYSSQDMLNKVGGFSPTLGNFGDAGGNGYAALTGKRYSRLILAPVNLASNVGARIFRDLPVCSSQLDALPAAPISGGSVPAGTEFNSAGGGRVLSARRVAFTALDAIATGVAGQTVAGASAVTQTFTSGSALAQVWQANTGGTVFVDMTTEANDAAATDFEPFAATSAIGDFVAFGMDATFEQLTFNSLGGTAGIGGVLVWEYWNGAAWTTLTVSDGTSGFTAAVSAAQVVSWTAPSNWAATAVNAVTKFYVRARATTAYATEPVLNQAFVDGLDWSIIARVDGEQGAKQGDIFVLGYDNLGDIAPAAEGGTYRVVSDAVAGLSLVVERLDGAAFVWTAQANVPWRLHVSSDADSAPVVVVGATGAGGYSAADAGGYVVPMRPITNDTGASADGSYTIGAVLTPSVVPTPVTGDSAGPLSGLGCRLHATVAMTFTQAVQGINVANDALLDALYASALDTTISEISPVSDINIVFAARSSANINSQVRQNAIKASEFGLGRMAVVSPALSVQDTATAISTAAPGVGATRDERVVYAWPGARTYIPEAAGFRIRTADGLTTIDGVLDISFASWTASLMSNMAPELNIGQSAEPTPSLLAAIIGIQRGVANLDRNDYIAFRDRGVSALRIDRVVGPNVQSGITSSLVAGRKNIARRRMADFIQDSIARALVRFAKLPATTANKDSAFGEVDTFLGELQSENNPAARRIHSYLADDVSGNTPELEAKGVYVIITKVRTLPSLDFIVLQTEIGEGVVTVTEA